MLSVGNFPPSAIPPKQLQNLLNTIKGKLPLNLELPVQSDKDIWQYYKYVKTNVHFENNKIFIFLKIPLINLAEQYDLIQAFNLPVINSNLTVKDSPDSRLTLNTT